MKKTRETKIAELYDKGVSFHLIDSHTVHKLMKDGKIDVPNKKLDIKKDERWNEKQLSSKIFQGILNGDSIDKIANSLTSIIKNNEASAYRNARTMTTAAECGGRLDSYKDLSEQGIIQNKVWMATPDDRTRKSHIDIDGEEVPIEEKFSNKCMFPGDGTGPSDEVWNCRCSMRTHIIGFKRKDGTISEIDYERDETFHDEQMAKEKERRKKKKERLKNR